jgi:hypothetical protein
VFRESEYLAAALIDACEYFKVSIRLMPAFFSLHEVPGRDRSERQNIDLKIGQKIKKARFLVNNSDWIGVDDN